MSTFLFFAALCFSTQSLLHSANPCAPPSLIGGAGRRRKNCCLTGRRAQSANKAGGCGGNARPSPACPAASSEPTEQERGRRAAGEPSNCKRSRQRFMQAAQRQGGERQSGAGTAKPSKAVPRADGAESNPRAAARRGCRPAPEKKQRFFEAARGQRPICCAGRARAAPASKWLRPCADEGGGYRSSASTSADLRQHEEGTTGTTIAPPEHLRGGAEEPRLYELGLDTIT